MYCFNKTSCIKIPQSLAKESWCETIIQDLTREVQDRQFPDETKKVKYYDVRDGHILIPRYYPIEKYSHRSLDFNRDGEDIDITSNIKLRNELQRSGFEFLTTNNYGILKLPPGEGKTVISIAAICHIKKKAIIYVHKDSLADQWKERFLQHSNIKDEDVALLSTSSAEYDLQKPVVISTVQTMCSMIKRIPHIELLMNKSNFGICIFDECHTSAGAEKYSLSSLYTPAKRTFGLSATPSRADKNHDVIGYHLGSVYDPDGKTATMTPRIIMLYFDHKALHHHRRYIFRVGDKVESKRNKFDIDRYYSMLCSTKNEYFVNVIGQVCKQIYNADRECLLIANRIKILDKLAKFIPRKNDVGFFIPRSKDKRNEHLLRKFIFSTPGSSRDGTDKPSFDTLVMATPIGNLDQAIGRVTRFKENKKQPIVFDLVDLGCSDMVTWGKKRLAYYQEKEYEIEEKYIK